ncbi:MAG: hypothetical protein JWN38_1144 [Candidatus Saccharibacteria bacterium]|nr:hypothetical protein [Candidatus Saccharibacteria bacterium]
MPFQEPYRLGGPEEISNPEVAQNLATLEAFTPERARIARSTATYIADELGGETQDIRLYYTAMFGRSWQEGASEHDPNYLAPLAMARLVTRSEGEPVSVLDGSNGSIGMLASFSEASFEPIKFEVKFEHQSEAFSSWRGRVAIAMVKVQPKRNGTASADSFELADEISDVTASNTATWQGINGGLEVHTQNVSEVETGMYVHIGSQFSTSFHGSMAYWLRQQLAPTDRAELSETLQHMQRSMRHSRPHYAQVRGVSEDVYLAEGLSPTIKRFFQALGAYAELDEPQPIDTAAVLKDWSPDAYDGQNLITELEVRDILELNQDGKLVVSALGRAAYQHLAQSR